MDWVILMLLVYIYFIVVSIYKRIFKFYKLFWNENIKKIKIKIYLWILVCRVFEAVLLGTVCREEYGMDWFSLVWLRVFFSVFIWVERKVGLEGFERLILCFGKKKYYYFDFNLVVGIGNVDIWCFLVLFYNFFSFFGLCKYINYYFNLI